MAFGRRGGNGLPFEQRLPDTAFAVHEFVPKPSTVAQEVTVHFVVVAVNDAAECPVALAGVRVAAERAVHANRRSKLLVPFARVMMLQGLVGEYTGGTDFDQVATKLILQNAIFAAAEKDLVPRRERVQIGTARVVAVVAHAAVALDAPVHLVIHQWAQVLVSKRALVEFVTPVVVAGHYGHVLQVTLAALVAHRAVMRMIQHQSFNDTGAERRRLRIINRDAR